MNQLHAVAQYLIANEKVDATGFEQLMRGETPSNSDSSGTPTAVSPVETEESDDDFDDGSWMKPSDSPNFPKI